MWMIISKLYAFHRRSTNLILTGLSGTANNFWYDSNGSWWYSKRNRWSNWKRKKLYNLRKRKKKAFENDRYIVNDLDPVALFVKQKKVNSRAHILFSLLASLIAHQSCQSLHIALEGCNRNNFYRLIFYERKFLIFGWQRTPNNFGLAYFWHLWPTKRSGMWPREFTVLVWQTRSVVASLRVEPEIRDTLHVLAEVLFFTRIAKVCKSEVSVRRRKTTCR